MPKGNPKAQTKATDRYQKKIGLTVKAFKIKQELADEFVETCNKAGEGQAAVISRLMRQYIEEHR